MKIEILTLFPELFNDFLTASLIGKSVKNNYLQITVTNIRDFASPPHFHVDDTPYGGGPGMVLKPEPLSKALDAAKQNLPKAPIVFPSPTGAVYNQQTAKEFSSQEELILLCGRYEGIDQRIIDSYVNYEVSLGDYILMGGEIPSMAIIESTARLIPQILGNEESIIEESFSHSSLEAPQYTKPQDFKGQTVPKVLTEGNHQKIREWRQNESLKRTKEKRPDLLTKEE